MIVMEMHCWIDIKRIDEVRNNYKKEERGGGGDEKRNRRKKADDGGSSVVGKKIRMKRTEDNGDLIPHTAASRVTHQSLATFINPSTDSREACASCTANMADFTW